MSADRRELRQALLPCLALAPLLAGCSSLLHGIVLGLGSLTVMVGTGLLLAAVGSAIAPKIRLIGAVLLAVAIACSLMLLVQAYSHSLHQAIGQYLPLLALGALAAMPAQNVEVAPARSLLRSTLKTAIGCMLVLITLGAFREILALGTLGAGIPLIGALWHGAAQPLLRVAALPAGAFIALGLLLALKRHLTMHRHRASHPTPPQS